MNLLFEWLLNSEAYIDYRLYEVRVLKWPA